MYNARTLLPSPPPPPRQIRGIIKKLVPERKRKQNEKQKKKKKTKQRNETENQYRRHKRDRLVSRNSSGNEIFF